MDSFEDDLPARRDLSVPVDFAFLAVQTFDDVELQNDVLGLFVAQARRVIPTLPGLSPRDQADAAHLIKGSARGVGAWPTAAAAAAYEEAPADRRTQAYEVLKAAFEAAEAAIAARLSGGDR